MPYHCSLPLVDYSYRHSPCSQGGIYRQNLPDLTNLLATVLIFVMDGRQVPKVSWSTRKLPIKLFYASNMPIILQTALVLLSRISCTVRLLGTWEEVEASAGRMIPGWRHCLLHFTTVDTFKEIIYDPLHAVFYLV